MDPFKRKVLFYAIKHLNILEVKLFDLLEALNKKRREYFIVYISKPPSSIGTPSSKSSDSLRACLELNFAPG